MRPHFRLCEDPAAKAPGASPDLGNSSGLHVPYAYTIRAARKQKVKKIHCTSAGSAIERRDQLAIKGWTVSIRNARGEPMTDAQVEALAQAEGHAIDIIGDIWRR